MTKKEAKCFLNVCRDSNIIKFNQIIKNNNLSQSTISRFLNNDDYDDMISITTLEKLINPIINNSAFILDMYNEIVNHQDISKLSVCDIVKNDFKKVA